MLFWAHTQYYWPHSWSTFIERPSRSQGCTLSQFSTDPNGHLSICVHCPIDLDDRCSDWDDKSPLAPVRGHFSLQLLKLPFCVAFRIRGLVKSIYEFALRSHFAQSPYKLLKRTKAPLLIHFRFVASIRTACLLSTKITSVNRICWQLWPKWLTFSLLTIDFTVQLISKLANYLAQMDHAVD